VREVSRAAIGWNFEILLLSNVYADCLNKGCDDWAREDLRIELMKCKRRSVEQIATQIDQAKRRQRPPPAGYEGDAGEGPK